MHSSSNKSHSVKKDLSSASSNSQIESVNGDEVHAGGLRLRNRKKQLSMVDAGQQSSKLKTKMEPAFFNDAFDDKTEVDDLVLLSDDVTTKLKSEYTSKFTKSEKSGLIDLIYGSDRDRLSTHFSKHNDANDSEEEIDETCRLNPNPPPDTYTNKILIDPSKGRRNSESGDEDVSRCWFKDGNGDDSDDEIVDDLSDEHESSFSICIQVFIPFLIAGFGTVGAGLVLDVVQHWDVFKNITEVFILVPALLGLKGNLEMTLASRLSTQANLGLLRTPMDQWNMAMGNIALIQCQAAVVGFLASCFAILMDWVPEGEFNLKHALLLAASSLLTASIASFVLGIVMIFVVIISSKLNINPDNVATPIAASLGDLTTLALLANISSLLYYTIDSSIWICLVLIFVFLSLVPVWTMIAYRNRYTREVLYTGWSPVVSAMAISSIGGCILDFAVSRFTGIAVFQPVINGVGGNLVAVQSSRISTYLHRRSHLGTLPKSDNKLCLSPLTAFCGNHIQARTARVLLAMVIPGHLIFTYGIHCIQAGHTSITATFLLVYLTAALIQVVLLLFSAHTMILYMWKKKIDPDNSAIPYLTALGDFLGTSLLALAFWILYNVGDKDSDVGD